MIGTCQLALVMVVRAEGPDRQMITLGRAQTSTRDDHDLAGSVQPSRRAYPQTLYHVGVVLGELGVAPRQPAMS